MEIGFRSVILWESLDEMSHLKKACDCGKYHNHHPLTHHPSFLCHDFLKGTFCRLIIREVGMEQNVITDEPKGKLTFHILDVCSIKIIASGVLFLVCLNISISPCNVDIKIRLKYCVREGVTFTGICNTYVISMCNYSFMSKDSHY